MLEAILAQKSTPKEGLIKDNSSKEGKDEGFKDLFAKIITKSTPKEGEEGQKEVSKHALESIGENKNSTSENKTLNNLLNSILQASKKDTNAVDNNTTLQSKLTRAKTILESTLNQKIDIKDLKDVKSLKELIIKANEKGLNVKDVKLDILSKKEEKELAQLKSESKTPEAVAKENRASNNTTQAQLTQPKERVMQSMVLSSLLHKKDANSQEGQQKLQTTLSNILADQSAKSKTKPETVDLKQMLQQESSKSDTSSKVESLLSSVVDKKTQNKEVQKEILNTKNNLQEHMQNKQQKESILQSFLDRKVDVKKDIELKSLQNSFARNDLNSLLSTKIQKSEIGLHEVLQKNIQEPKQEVKTGFMHQTQNIGQKIFDAKETIKGFASNLKEQIQNYKPPISKIMLTLNPQTLGEVDVVIKSRGDSLSVQINSATAPALQVLAQNSADLRQNLVNMGFENLSMQFSSNSNGGQNNQQANEGSTSQRHRYEEDELDEELIEKLDQIEINLPKYV